MKKVLITALLLAAQYMTAQINVDEVDGLSFGESYTTAYLNGLSTPRPFLLVRNSDLNALVYWNGSAWVQLGAAGTTYTFGTGLAESGGTVTVTNPFEAADESKLDGIATGATVGANWNTNLTNIPANLDLDGSGTAVTAGTNVTVTGTGTTASPYVINSTASGTGDVTGPASATDRTIPVFDGSTGKLLETTNIGVSAAGDINMNARSITAMADPSAPSDAATKNYVDAAVDDIIPYRDIYSGGATTSATIPQSNGRMTLTSTAASTDVVFTGASLNQGQPIVLHLISDNVAGTTFNFNEFVEDNQGNSSFSVTLADNEERTLHFVVMDPNLTRCTNYPIANGGTDDQTLSLSGTDLSIENGNTVDLSGLGGGTGDVTKVGTPTDNQLAIWTGDGTIEGTDDLIHDGIKMTVNRVLAVNADVGNPELQVTRSGSSTGGKWYINASNEMIFQNTTTNALDNTQFLENTLFGGTMNLNNNKIVNLSDPTLDQDAATKAYVDANDDTGTDDQTISLGGTGNTSLSIESGNTVALPVLANADQAIANSATREISMGASGRLNIDDSSGRTKFFVESNSVAQAEGTHGIQEGVLITESSGGTNDELSIVFDFATAANKTLLATENGITYDGKELTGAYTNTTSGLAATDVQAAIDEVVVRTSQNADNNSNTSQAVSEQGIVIDSIVTALGTPAVSEFEFVSKTVADTAIVADARDNRVILLDYDDENFTIPAGVFSTGNAIRIQSIGTGTARIVSGDGVSFSPWDGFQLDSISKSITLARINADTGPEDWFPLDGDIKNYLDILPPPLAANGNTELITTALAFTPLDIATSPGTGINNNSITTVLSPTWSVVDAAANDYGVEKAIRATATASTNDRINYWLVGVTIGATYDVAILHRNHDGNGSSRVRMVSAESNVLFDYQTSGTDWVLGTSTFTPTSTQVRFEMYGNFGGATDAGSADYIISVKLQE